MSDETSGPSGTPKKMAAKPKDKDHKHKNQSAEKGIKGVREGEQGHMWYRRVGGDRGNITHMTTVRKQRQTNLFGSLSRNEEKRDKKGAARATVPGTQREKVRERNATMEC